MPTEARATGGWDKKGREEPPFRQPAWVSLRFTITTLELLTQCPSPLLGYNFQEKDHLYLCSAPYLQALAQCLAHSRYFEGTEEQWLAGALYQ